MSKTAKFGKKTQGILGLKLSLQTRFKVFFQKDMPSLPVNITFHIFHFINRIGMNQSLPYRYDLSNMAQFSSVF
jgi:hypothetical protein